MNWNSKESKLYVLEYYEKLGFECSFIEGFREGYRVREWNA